MADTMHALTHTKPDYALCAKLALRWEEIQEMIQSGLCSVGTHSVAHVGLNRMTKEQMVYELNQSRKDVLEHLGIEPKHMSYPHSMYNDEVLQAVKEAGYKSATLGYGGSIRKGDDPYLLNRKYIVQE